MSDSVSFKAGPNAIRIIRDEGLNPDKINVGALGNLVPQLHVHVIGRFKSDRAWPEPIWGTGPVEAYEKNDLINVFGRMRAALKGRIK